MNLHWLKRLGARRIPRIAKNLSSSSATHLEDALVQLGRCILLEQDSFNSPSKESVPKLEGHVDFGIAW